MKELLFDLCKRGGVSGNEDDISLFCKEYLSKYTDKVYINSNKSVIAELGDNNSDYTFLLDAHLDKIGFIVSEIDDNGFVRVDTVGGIDLRTVLDSRVTVYAKENLNGVVCCMPPHLSDGKEDEAVKADKIWIDLGLPADKVKESVKIGDTAAFNYEPKELINGKITACALDNRAGVASLLKVCEIISNQNINSKVIIVLSSQEETYAAGAKTAPFNYDIDESICVDVSFAACPGIDDNYSNIKLSYGPMLCISPNLNRQMFDSIKDLAENKNIPYQIEVCNGKTGTNADHIALSKSGVKSALISIPEKNMHTQSEIVDIKDVEFTAKLISSYIIKGGLR